MTTAPDPAAAKACVEHFLEAMAAGDVATAETLTLPIDPESGFKLDPSAFPPGGTISIGDPQVDGDCVVVPCTADDQSFPPLPAVCVATDDGVRISMEATMQRAFGGDPMELVSAMSEGMEAMAGGLAEGMGSMMNAMADGLSEAFAGGDGADDGCEDGDAQAAFDDMVEDHLDYVLPGFERQLAALLGHPISFDVDWSGCDSPSEVLYLGTIGASMLVNGLCVLAGDPASGGVLPGALERIHLAWYEHQTQPALDASQGTLSCTVGPFLDHEGINPVELAAGLRAVLELV